MAEEMRVSEEKSKIAVDCKCRADEGQVGEE